MEVYATVVLLPIFCLLAIACWPPRQANQNPTKVYRAVSWLLGIQCSLALMLVIAQGITGGTVRSISLLEWFQTFGGSLSVYVDGASSLMLLMVSFVGFVVTRFSIRYLDGEASQGRYFRWLSFAIGAVSLLVVAGNLLLFVAAWMMTSFGLHQLLLHYRHRDAAHRAAWTKFAISRLGDVFLIAALIITYQSFGTLDFGELFAAAKEVAAGSQVTMGQAAIGWLLMLGAVTKSAQFPFHTWLPDTMETPTPVSALMHAGIVNAGGYLVIRMSPLLALTPAALTTLAVIGAFTACFAGVVMMTQSSVKRALAYSTIAQMGFMMLQCGIGAFSVAMLHILAHSLYKAHAFLSSGSVISQRAAMTGAKSPSTSPLINAAYLSAAGSAVVLVYFLISSVAGANVYAKPGGLVLSLILCLALTTWGWRLFKLGDLKTTCVGLAGVAGLCLTYVVSYLGVNHLLSPSLPEVGVSPTMLLTLVGIGLGFTALFALHVVVMQRIQPRWLDSLRVHAASGFYIDAIVYRLFASIAKS